MADEKRSLKVFLAHASSDKPKVRELYRYLKRRGIQPWLDAEDLLPGQDWQIEIPKAINTSDTIIICLSKGSVSKEGYVQREMRFILERALEMPEGRIFLVPVRFEECDVPRALRTYQWVDLFADGGYEKLMRALKLRATQLQRNANIMPKALDEIHPSKELSENSTKVVLNQKSNIPVKKQPKLRTEYVISLIGAAAIIIAALIELIPKSLEQIIVLLQNQTAEILISIQQNFVFILFSIFMPIISLLIGMMIYRANKQISKNKFDAQKNFVLYKNPYIAGNPIDPALNPRMFFGRSDVVQMVYKEIKEPSQKPSLLLFGRRRMGKTSALLNLGRLMRDLSIVDIYISAQDIKYRADSDLIFNLIQLVISKLRAALSETKLFTDEQKYKDLSNYQQKPVHVLSNFFAECNKILEDRSLYCLFMFDEYELLSESISKDFFMQIRDTMQHKPRFVFLFAGTHMPNELGNNGNWKEVFMNVKVLHISFLDRQDSYKLLTEPVPNLKYANEKLIYQILDLTGCQPLLLQAMASEIINQLNIARQSIVDKNIINCAIENVLKSWSYNFFDNLWSSECDSPADKEFLVKIAKNNGIMKLSSPNDASIKKLMDRDLLVSKDGYIKLSIPFIINWLKKENRI